METRQKSTDCDLLTLISAVEEKCNLPQYVIDMEETSSGLGESLQCFYGDL